MEKHYIEVQKELELVTKERDKGKTLQKLPVQAPSTTSMPSLIRQNVPTIITAVGRTGPVAVAVVVWAACMCQL